MSDKPEGKNKRPITADLNYISNQPLEAIVDELSHLDHPDVVSHVIWSPGENIALFQLTYSREARPTAEITGRLQRWAGEMTHVYCDGRTILKKSSYVWGFMRWMVTVAVLSPFITCPLAMMASPAATDFLDTLYGLSIFAFFLGIMYIGFTTFFAYLGRVLKVNHADPRQHLAKPEKKDRERLLHLLTEIIRDDNYHLNMKLKQPEAVNPLTDAEINRILEQAELMTRLKQ